MHVGCLTFQFSSGTNPELLRSWLREAKELEARKSHYEAIMKLNDVLRLDPDNEEAQRMLRSVMDEIKPRP